MLHPDDELPEDHDALLELAAGVRMPVPPRLTGTAVLLPEQRPVVISDEATSLVDGPLVGFSTHGR